MAAPIQPALTPTFGREAWVWVPTIADITDPVVTELTGAGTYNLTGYLLADQFGGASVATSRVTLPRVLLQTQSYESIGDTTWTVADLVYSIDPQAAGGSNAKKAYEALDAGAAGYLVRRLGDVGTADLGTGDFVDIFPVVLGPALANPTSNDASGVVAVTQPVSVTGAPSLMVVVAAS